MITHNPSGGQERVIRSPYHRLVLHSHIVSLKTFPGKRGE
jgi:hypothetical protein